MKLFGDSEQESGFTATRSREHERARALPASHGQMHSIRAAALHLFVAVCPSVQSMRGRAPRTWPFSADRTGSWAAARMVELNAGAAGLRLRPPR